MRKLVLSIAGILVFAFIVISAFAPDEKDLNLNTATAELMSFEVKVNTVGVLDAERSHVVSSTIKGDKGKILYLADDGTTVNKGDILIKFDPTPFEDEVRRLTGELKSREAVVEAENQVLEWEKSQAEGTVNNAEFNLKDAGQEYERYISYIRDLEDLSKKGYSYPNEITQAKKKAEQLYAKMQKAEMEQEQSRKEVVFKIANAMAGLKKANSEFETTRLLLEEAQDQLKKTVVHAPFSGIAVLYESFRDNQKRKPRAGDAVWQNQSLLYLPDISSMIVETQVREIDLHKIKIGQQAKIQIDAYPDTAFEGEVTSIGILAAERPESGRGEKYFQLTVALKGDDTRLRPGMTARVVIEVNKAKDALSVPIQAIFKEEDKIYCYLLKGNNFKKVEVSIGRQNEDMVEILSGLKRGDKVSLVEPSSDKIL